MNEIAEFWPDRRLLGQSAFSETRTGTRFQQIPGALTLHPPEHPTFDKERDPLWQFAVPIGVSSIDAMTVRTKARTRARTFMPSKPDKYSVRFYAVVGWSSLYVHSLWDNSSGNTMPSTPAERYTGLFPILRTPLYNTLRADEVTLEQESAIALWITMAGYQTRAMRSPTGHRLVVSDNFYTHHTFAQALLKFTDGEMHLLGTVRINLVDKWNKPVVSVAVTRADGGPRGGWGLVAAVDPEPGWGKKKQVHQNAQRRIAKAK
ncbi:hypothetical protein JG687_00014642 [Phytophthora cactorum]|uniref:PiggyBac transposable element-derived protein domain-containing protein n=1 Tax=Phytophthora cactorum TaxID=29920 RepID=A0A8T1TX46_9STRA|nr:hypothetical protein JG687_00014642 [Phytophthora cactorum]